MIGILDSQVIEKFKVFQNQTGKYRDLNIDKVEFKKIYLSDEAYFKLTMGQSPEGKYLNKHSQGIPFYQGKTDFGEQYLEKPTTWTIKSKKTAQVNDILISLRAPAGAVNIANIDLSIGRGLASIRCLNNINYIYVYQSLKNNENKINSENNKGGFFSSMNRDYLYNLEVPIPQKTINYNSTDIQNAIVEFLEFWKVSYTDAFRKVVMSQKPILEKIKKSLLSATLKYDKALVTSFNAFVKNKGLDIHLEDIKFDNKSIIELVNISRGKVISKEDLVDNGLYPVYSSQTKEEGLFGYINDFMFDGDAITWTTDGKHAGTTFLRSGKFNYTNVCGLMTIKDEQSLDIKYLSYITKEIFPKHVDRTSQNSKLMTHHLDNILVQIPTTEKYDSIDIQKLLIEFWETISHNIDNQFNKFENLISLTDKVDTAFLYRMFGKIYWRSK